MVEEYTKFANGSNLNLDLNINTLRASRSSENYSSNEALDFKVDAKLEETSRRSGEVMVTFELRISTEPDVAVFDIGGQVKVKGEPNDIEGIIATDPNTPVPLLITEIYSRVYSMIFLLASGIKIAYPSAGLLHSDNELPSGNASHKPDSTKTTQTEKVEETVSNGESATAAQRDAG